MGLKGIFHEMDLAFDDMQFMHGQFKTLIGDAASFLIF